MRARDLLSAFAATMLLCSYVFSQSPVDAQTSTKITVPIFLSAKNGELIGPVKAEDFAVLDGKSTAEPATLLRGHDAPLRVGLLIDKSGSSRQISPAALPALNKLIEEVLRDPRDRAFYGMFDETLEATGWVEAKELSAIQRSLIPSGAGTALFRTIVYACQARMADQTPGTRRVLLLLTDGEDNGSALEPPAGVAIDAAIESAQKNGVAIFAISTVSEGESGRGHKVLKRLTEETGGMAAFPVKNSAIPSTIAKIKGQIENMYLLTYSPPDGADGGKAHEIAIRFVADKNVKVRAPKNGFTATN